MKRLAALLLLAPALAHAHYVYLGTIAATSGTSKTNDTTASPFYNTSVPSYLAGLSLAVQCDAAAYVAGVLAGSTAVAKTGAGAGVKIDADMFFPIDMGRGANFVGVIGDTASVNCRVYLVLSKRPGGVL